jgi:(p)ppGpp synthase/HD superfamily hydrolase
MDLTTFARNFAIKHHGDQKYNEGPYVNHLDAVAQVAKRFGYGNQTVLACCSLHDVIEDTDATVEEVRSMFGTSIAMVVNAVSDPPGTNRKERKALAYPEIRKVPMAVCVKLCDRIANVEVGGKLNMYKSEYPEFKKALYKKGEYDNLWNHLDTLLS